MAHNSEPYVTIGTMKDQRTGLQASILHCNSPCFITYARRCIQGLPPLYNLVVSSFYVIHVACPITFYSYRVVKRLFLYSQLSKSLFTKCFIYHSSISFLAIYKHVYLICIGIIKPPGTMCIYNVMGLS